MTLSEPRDYYSKFVRDQMSFSFVVLISVLANVSLCFLFCVLVHKDNLKHLRQYV